VEFGAAAGGDGPRGLHRVVRALQHSARLDQERAAGFGQAHGLGGALQKREAELFFEVADLPADPRLLNVQLQGGVREVLGFSHGHEVTEMAEFHAPASMLIGYAEARKMVFLSRARGVARLGHDEYTKSK
jgi:hypothetical protein